MQAFSIKIKRLGFSVYRLILPTCSSLAISSKRLMRMWNRSSKIIIPLPKEFVF